MPKTHHEAIHSSIINWARPQCAKKLSNMKLPGSQNGAQGCLTGTHISMLTVTVQGESDSFNHVHYIQKTNTQSFSHTRRYACKKPLQIVCTCSSHYSTLRLAERTRLPSSLQAFLVAFDLRSPPGWPQHTQPKMYIRGHVDLSACETLVPH